MITSDLYILYGFLAFISLLLVAALGFLIRIAFAVGRLQGQYNGLSEQMNGLSEQMRELNASLNARIDRLEEQMNNFREQLAEVRGLMRGLHDRLDLLMRHRHDDAGRVVIIPEEVAAD